MIILFAPAKTFDFDATVKAIPNYQFKKDTKQLIQQVTELSQADFLRLFKLPVSKAADTYQYFFQHRKMTSYLAMSFFKGEAYKALNYPSMCPKQQAYLNQKTFILDALYGVIKPTDGIKPYRMDFTISLDLRAFWKDKINQYFIPYQKEPFLSLASKEFSSLIDKNVFDVYEVSFLDCKNNQCKAISVFNKQNRGYLLDYVTKNEIDDIERLPQSFRGYTLKKADKQLIYMKSID